VGGLCFPQCMLYLVDAALGVCLYSVVTLDQGMVS